MAAQLAALMAVPVLNACTVVCMDGCASYIELKNCHSLCSSVRIKFNFFRAEEENSPETYFPKIISILISKSVKIIRLFKKGIADELGQGHIRNFRPFWLLQQYF